MSGRRAVRAAVAVTLAASTGWAAVAAAAGPGAAVGAGAAGSGGGDRPRGDVRVFAHVPAPGYPALSLVTPDRVYVGTFTGVAGGTTGPSKVFAWTHGGRLVRTYTVRGQTPGGTHAVQVAAQDRQGRLYLLDQSPPRVVRLDPRTGRQRTWATFADVPTCSSAGAPQECSNTLADNPPEPDYAAWLPDGSMVVTDYAQQLLWRVPPGGGRARVWLNDLQLDGEEFGPAGIVLRPNHRSLLLMVSASIGVNDPDPDRTAARGALYRIRIDSSGHPTDLARLWRSGPGEAPDGFALARSGHVYVALSGPAGNAVAELARGPLGHWHEVWRVPGTAVDGATQPVPWDTPTSAQFLGDRLLVTNQAYFTGNTADMVVFDVAVGERAAPSYRP